MRKFNNEGFKKFLTENTLTDTSKYLSESALSDVVKHLSVDTEGEDNREVVFSKSDDYGLSISHNRGEYVIAITDEQKDGYPIKVLGKAKDAKKAADMFSKAYKSDWKKYANK